MKERSKTFCIVPWVQAATNASGNYRVCCNGIPGKNLVMGSDGKPFKINKNSIEEVWNSPFYQKIRKQFLDGEIPEMCTRCFREEDAGIESARQKNNLRWQSDQENDTEIDLGIKYLDLRLGNNCNLKCRMCNPYASSKWVEEWNDVVKEAQLVPNFSLNDEEYDRLKNINWPGDNRTWDHLDSIVENIEEIYLTGGEPFLSSEHKRILQKLIDENRSQDIVLKYNTNMTLLPEEFLDLWQEFKLVRVNASLDAIGDLNHYIRYPAQWDVIEENLYKLYSLKNVEVGIHITVQMYNILDLAEIYKYFVSNYSTEPYLNILNHPHCLNIRTLPNELLEEAYRRLDELKNYKEIQDVISYLSEERWSDKHFNEFISYTKRLDEIRTQSFVAEVSEFKNYF